MIDSNRRYGYSVPPEKDVQIVSSKDVVVVVVVARRMRWNIPNHVFFFLSSCSP